jgi:predicted secreted protein
MSVKLGDEMKLYLCAAGIGGTPEWTEVTLVKDVTLSHSKGEADVSTRGGGGWKQIVGAMKEAVIEFEMVWDTEDAAFQLVKDAYFNDTLLGLAVMDGPIATPGSEGLWADCAILKFDRKEPLENAVTVGVTAKPTYSAEVPQWKVIGD